MSQHTVQQRPHAHGDVLTAISDGMVALLSEFYGHGPTRTKSYYADDLVVCVLRGGFSRVEQTLLEGGRGAAVIEQRMEFQELMRERFEEVIERATGRAVIGFMSGNQQHPDMMCEVFILAPTDLLDEHEIAANGRPSPPGSRIARSRFALPIVYAGGSMADDKNPTERTPKGLEVPIPKRGEFFANLKRVAKVRTPSAPPAPKK